MGDRLMGRITSGWGIILAASVVCTVALASEPENKAAVATPTCDYGDAHANAPDELSQFDFLIGDYTIAAHRWMGEQWSPPAPTPPARWNGRYILGGMAIEDEWYGVDPGLDPATSRGVNVRMWDAEDQEWDMMWVHSQGRAVQDLRAKVIDGKLTMWQVYPERADFKAYFERTGPDSWHRIHLKKDDNGEWQPLFKLAATRIPCPADQP